MRILKSGLLGIISIACTASAVLADAKKPNFNEDILPIFKQHCLACHGNDKQRGGLNVATYAATMQGGASGDVVKLGDPDKSRLYTLTAHKEEPKMPPKADRIPEAQVNLIRLWVEQGARENSGSKVMVAAKPKTDIGLKSITKGRPEGAPPMPLPGKLALEPVVHARRAGAVIALATSPWAPLVAVGGQKQVLLYNTDTGELLGVLPYEHGQVHNIKFSRNGRLLLVAGGHGGQAGKAVLFRVDTGEKVTEVGVETDAILSADISADQTQIAVGSSSKLIRIYSTTDGSVLREIKKHTDWVTSVEFSPDGVLLATGDRNGGLFVWESFTGREYFSLRGHTAMITDVSWRDDSNVLASASLDTTIKLWEMENGNAIKSWGAHGAGVESVKYSHDNRLASTGRDRVTKVWDQNGAAQKQFEAFPDYGLSVAVTHENARVVAGSWNGFVKTWQIADAKMVALLDANPMMLADRIKAAETAVAAADAKVKSVTAQVAATKANVDKANAELAVFQKAATDSVNMANAAKAAVAPSKAEVDKWTAAVTASQIAVSAKTLTQNLLQEAATKLQAESAKAPQNAELKAQVAKVTDIVKAASGETATAQKALTDAQAALTAANTKFAAVQKTAGDSTSLQAAAQQKLTAEQAARKAIFDAANTATAQLAAAEAELTQARAMLAKMAKK